jgi:hypothetical protein
MNSVIIFGYWCTLLCCNVPVAVVVVLLEAGLELPANEYLETIEDYESNAKISCCLSYQYAIYWLSSLIDCVVNALCSLSSVSRDGSQTDNRNHILRLLIDRFNLVQVFEIKLISLAQRVPEFLEHLGLQSLVAISNDTAKSKKTAKASASGKGKQSSKASKAAAPSSPGGAPTNTQLNTQLTAIDSSNANDRPKLLQWERIVSALNTKRSKLSGNLVAMLSHGLPTVPSFERRAVAPSRMERPLTIENTMRILLLANENLQSNIRSSDSVAKLAQDWAEQRVFGAFNKILMNTGLLASKISQCSKANDDDDIEAVEEDGEGTEVHHNKYKVCQTWAIFSSLVMSALSSILQNIVSLTESEFSSVVIEACCRS